MIEVVATAPAPAVTDAERADLLEPYAIFAALVATLKAIRGRSGHAIDPHFSMAERDTIGVFNGLVDTVKTCAISNAIMGVDLAAGPAVAERLGIAFTPEMPAELEALNVVLTIMLSR